MLCTMLLSQIRERLFFCSPAVPAEWNVNTNVNDGNNSARMAGLETRTRSIEQPIHVLLRIENDQIINLLTNAYIPDRQVQFPRDRDGNAAFRGSI
jgi:hypothetical protein